MTTGWLADLTVWLRGLVGLSVGCAETGAGEHVGGFGEDEAGVDGQDVASAGLRCCPAASCRPAPQESDRSGYPSRPHPGPWRNRGERDNPAPAGHGRRLGIERAKEQPTVPVQCGDRPSGSGGRVRVPPRDSLRDRLSALVRHYLSAKILLWPAFFGQIHPAPAQRLTSPRGRPGFR